MVRTLKALQDTLGRFQDREVQAEMLSALAAGLEDSDGDGTQSAIRRLVERLHRDQDEARAEFSERFAAFSAPEQRLLVQQTFSPD
jgi:CHAD domain-containing protein